MHGRNEWQDTEIGYAIHQEAKKLRKNKHQDVMQAWPQVATKLLLTFTLQGQRTQVFFSM